MLKRSQRILFVFMSVFSLTCASLQASSTVKNLTPNENLIYAVRGVKNGWALMASVFNPIAGILVASMDIPESDSDLKAIDKCLQEGAHIDYAEEHTGYTALIYAAYYGYPKIAKHLISNGASIHLRSHDGYDATGMSMYYIEKYKRSLKYNEEKKLTLSFSEKDREKMRIHYLELIERYQSVLDLIQGRQ